MVISDLQTPQPFDGGQKSLREFNREDRRHEKRMRLEKSPSDDTASGSEEKTISDQQAKRHDRTITGLEQPASESRQGSPHTIDDLEKGNLSLPSSFCGPEEQEDKKLRRKQSNRESARRSRMRKQAECEALSTSVSDLQQENFHLRAANKAMAVTIGELEAKLKEKSSTPAYLFRPTPRNGAFTAVLPSKQTQNLDPGCAANGPSLLHQVSSGEFEHSQCSAQTPGIRNSL